MTTQAQPQDAPARAPEPRDDPASAYSRAPWYRKSELASGVIVSFLVTWVLWVLMPLGALLNFAAWLGVVGICAVVLTGPVYYNRYDDDGNVKTWRAGNKIAAALFLALSAAMIALSQL